MQLHAKNNFLLKSLKSGARCLNFSLEVIDRNIRNPKLVPGGEMTDENNSYISNLFVDSDVHSVILIQDIIGFRISRPGFRIPGTGSRTLSTGLGLLIPIVIEIPDSLSCIRFRIPKPKISDLATSKNFPYL